MKKFTSDIRFNLSYQPLDIPFQQRYMPYDKSPQKFCLHTVITMYDTVPCVYYIPGVWQFYSRIPLQYPVYGLPP